jgi:cell division protein FtsL
MVNNPSLPQPNIPTNTKGELTMKSVSVSVFVGVVIVLVIIGLVIGFWFQNKASQRALRITELNKDISQRDQQISDLLTQVETSNQKLKNLEAEKNLSFVESTPENLEAQHQIAQLIQQEIKNLVPRPKSSTPVSKSKSKRKSKVIPKPQPTPPPNWMCRSIKFLSPNIVLVTYDDGQKAGAMLIKATSPKDIKGWKILYNCNL